MKNAYQFLSRILLTVACFSFMCFSTLVHANSEPTAEIHKKIEPVKDGSGKVVDDQYELTLDITSKSGSVAQTQPLDVVFVADFSGSMTTSDVDTFDGYSISRLQALKRQLIGNYYSGNGLIDQILSNPKNRLSIVRFAGAGRYSRYSDADIVQNWSSNAQAAKSAVDRTTVEFGIRGIGNGTNISAGLHTASDLLKNARTDAKKVVILLSDGQANLYYDNSGYTRAAEYNPYESEEALRRELSPMIDKLDGFYSIKYRYGNSFDSIRDVHYYVQQAATSSGRTIPNQIFSANDEESLKNEFHKIVEKIMPVGLRKVTISDTLSKYVALLGDSIDTSDVKVVKTNRDGVTKTLTTKEVTVTREPNLETGLVEVTAKFADDYVLDDGAVYALKFKVKSTQAALDAIAGDSKLTPKDAQNGDSTKLYSNEEAHVKYTYGVKNPIEKIQKYSDMPTFSPSQPSSIPVEVMWKDVNGDNHVTAPTPQVSLQLVQSKADAPSNTNPKYRSIKVQTPNGKGKFEKVAKGYHYDVTAEEVKGFTKTVKNVGTETSPSFQVIYQQLPTLTVEKIVEGEDDSSKVYNIKVSAMVPKDGSMVKLPDGKYGEVTFSNGQATLHLKAGESKQLLYLPKDTDYQIEEETSSAKGYQVIYQHQKETLTKDIKATVTNRVLPSLSIKKEVSGAFANLLQSFDITVELKAKDGAKINGDYSAKIGSQTKTLHIVDGKVTVTLKRNETITIERLPLNATYSVKEDAQSAKGYEVSYTDHGKGTLTKSKLVVVTNHKNSVPETAIDTLQTPLFLGVLAVVSVTIVGLSIVVIKRRKDWMK